MTLTVTPTINLASTPPSVSLQVTDSTGANSSVTIQRYVSGGKSGIVRTSDGGPFPLTTSGSTKIGTLVDYEPPYGAPVSYSANGGTLTGSVVLAVSVVWLVNPIVPNRSMPITLRVGSFDKRSRTTRRGVFQPIGRSRPIVVTDGSRSAAQSTLIVATASDSERASLDTLLGDEQVLLLNVPAQLGLGVPTDYISVGDVDEGRPSSVGTDAARDWTLPYLVVDAPVSGTAAITTGGTPGARTWADLAVERVTWANAKAAYSTWTRAEAGTPG